MEFISSSSTLWCGGLLDSDVGSVIFPNSGEPFRLHRSSLAEGEHTITFTSSISFRFVVPVHILRSSPSNPYLSSSLCMFYLQSPWPTRSVKVPAQPTATSSHRAKASLPADARCGAAEPKFYREKEKVCEKAP
jgi:hypothetical protein